MSRHHGALFTAVLTGAVVLGGSSPAQVGKVARPATPVKKRLDRAKEAAQREADARARALARAFERLEAIQPDQFVAVPPAPVAPAQPMVGVVINGAVKQVSMEERYVMMYRSTLRAEYQILVTVCEPSQDQRRQVARAGESALKAAAKQVAERRTVNAQNNPRATIREALLKAAGDVLTDSQVARYKDEIAARVEQQKEAAIRNLVAAFDQTLYLSADQRAKLSATLKENWTDSLGSDQAMNYANANQFLPMIPDNYIVPLLSPEQAKVWRETQKVQVASYGILAAGFDDTPLEDAELEEAPKGEPGKVFHGR
jgi:hypothetical protein